MLIACGNYILLLLLLGERKKDLILPREDERVEAKFDHFTLFSLQAHDIYQIELLHWYC